MYANQNLTITVIISAYNAEATLGRAITSALQQPEAAEVIVIDDASTDHTVKKARAADDGTGRLKIISLSSNSGPSAARNRAIKESRAPWIAILDADDFFLPGRLQQLLKFADAADIIADDLWRVDEYDIDGPRTLFLGDLLPEARFITFAEFVNSNISDRRRQRGELGFIKPIMRRSFLEKHGLRYQENMRLGEDYELYARALALGAKLYLMPAQGYVSVVRAQSLSGRHSENDLLQLRNCDIALAALPSLTNDDKKALHKHYLSIDCRLQWRLLILAVKERHWGSAMRTFMRPLPVPLYLGQQLLEQLVLRLGKKLKS